MSNFFEKIKNHHLPENWTPMLPGEETRVVDVHEGKQEYKEVCGKLANCDFLKVKKLQRIQNPYLWGCYLLKKQECKQISRSIDEVTLYHQTSTDNVQSIIADNFDWRRYRNTMFGKGVNFSSCPEYAYKNSTFGGRKSNNIFSSDCGAMFVARVLRGRCTRIEQYDCELPPEGWDTTTSGVPKYLVVVAYNDNDFYPEYVVYWESKYSTSSATTANPVGGGTPIEAVGIN